MTKCEKADIKRLKEAVNSVSACGFAFASESLRNHFVKDVNALISEARSIRAENERLKRQIRCLKDREFLISHGAKEVPECP